jgi:hypothetical protein
MVKADLFAFLGRPETVIIECDNCHIPTTAAVEVTEGATNESGANPRYGDDGE